VNKDDPNEKIAEFECPHCRTLIAFRVAIFGTVQECPYCNEVLVVPTDGSRIGRKLNFPLVTPRLQLRPLVMDDLENWLEFVKDEDTYKYLWQYPPTDQEVIEWLRIHEKIRFAPDNKWFLPLAIESSVEKKLVGTIHFDLGDLEQHWQGNFEIIIHPTFRSRGFGTETVKAISDFGFNQIALHDIRVRVDVKNLAGRRMVEKAGMKLEGEFFEEHLVKCEWTSGAYYAAFARAPRS
jgi:RimJ/RimL family protein N-acetyltransferase